MDAGSRRRALAGLVAALAAITILSQFLRTSGGVIAPEMTAALDMTPEQLGAANGAFFLALGVMQLPVGILFDRFGPRRTVFWLNWVAVGGCVLHGIAGDAQQLIAARFLMGLGCGGNFMAAVLLYSRWHPPTQLAAKLSVMFALSQGGTLLAATPLALASGALGWRTTFLWVAALTALIGVMLAACVRDHPPDQPRQPGPPEPLSQALAGVLEVWRTPGLGPILGIHLVAYASMLTVLGLWAAPYLHDVHGLGGVARGNVLLAMAAMQVIGILVFGRLTAWAGTLNRVVMIGGLASVAVMTTLAAWPGPPLGAAVALLIAHCLVTSYSIVIVTQGRRLFPDRLAGRGVTTVNIAQVLGCFGLPVLTGTLIGLFPATDGAPPEIAYRAAFACIAAVTVLGLLIYRRAPGSTQQPPTPEISP